MLDNLVLQSVDPDDLRHGDIFLWKSMDGIVEMHVFHSSKGYGIKTMSQFNELDGSSVIVNYSGFVGILRTKHSVRNDYPSITYKRYTYWYEYRKALNGEICIASKEPTEYCNGFYIYSSKDSGNGLAHVVVYTDDPDSNLNFEN